MSAAALDLRLNEDMILGIASRDKSNCSSGIGDFGGDFFGSDDPAFGGDGRALGR